MAGRNLSFSSLLVFTSTISLSQGFAPLPGLVRTQRRGLAAIQPEHIDSLHHLSSILLSDTDALVDAVTSIVDTANAVADPSLADAATAAVTDAAASSDATAVADAVSAAQDAATATAAAAAATDDGGWWQAYLNVFKSTLLLIHNTIDGPLREQGITQTWGIAIAIFTFCKQSIPSLCFLQPSVTGFLTVNPICNSHRCTVDFGSVVGTANQVGRVHQGSQALHEGDQGKVQGQSGGSESCDGQVV